MKAKSARVGLRSSSLALAAGLGVLLAGASSQALAQTVCVTAAIGGTVSCSNPTGAVVANVSTAASAAIGVPTVATTGAAAAQSLTVGTATSTGAGASAISGTGTTGPLTITSGTASASGSGSVGVIANTTSGPLVINALNTTATGVNATGIAAFSNTGPVTVNVGLAGGGVTATGDAIVVSTGGPATVNVATGALVQGGARGVSVNAGQGATLTNAGTIQATAGPAVVIGAGGTIGNSGTINGVITATGANPAIAFNNSGTFNASGSSTLPGTINNSGVITAGLGGPVPAATVLAGPLTLNNTGTISLADGQAGDTLTLSGGTLVGSPTGRVALDADLGVAGTPADRVVAGQLVGTTTVVLNATNPTGPGLGVLNPTGTPIVVGGGGGTVVLDGGTVQNGFVDFTIQPMTGGFALVGSPALAAYQTVKAGAIAAEYWYASADAWSSRLTEVRDVAENRPDGLEFWGHFFGADRRYSTKGVFNAFGAPARRDLGLRQDFLGFQGGFDVSRSSGGSTVLWGMSGGFTGSHVRFNTTRDGAYLTGLNVGAYAAYVSGGFYANLLGKVDLYEVAWNSRTASSYDEFRGRSYGVMAETGYRFGGPGLFIEPNASLTYVRSSLKDMRTAAAVFDFDKATSVRGKLGGRIGTTLTSGGASFTPFIGASAVHEFDGDNLVDFSSGGFRLPIKDQPARDYGVATLGVDGSTLGGLNAFIRADYAFDRVHGIALQGGVRFRF